MFEEIQRAALEKERSADYGSAATLFYTAAIYRISESMFEEGHEYRKGIVTIVRAVSNDVSADNYNRAGEFAALFQELVQPLIASDSPVIRGLGYEWLGDIGIMTNNASALQSYESAAKDFESLDFQTQMHWGARPEYDIGLLAMESFFNEHDISYYEKHDLDFSGRIEWKLRIGKRLLHSS